MASQIRAHRPTTRLALAVSALGLLVLPLTGCGPREALDTGNDLVPVDQVVGRPTVSPDGSPIPTPNPTSSATTSEATSEATP